MSKKILITGGAGFIGSHVVENFVNKNYNVTVIDNLSTGNLSNLNAVFKKIKFHNVDIRNLENIENIFKDIDYVIHLASMTNAENSFKDKKKMYDNNLGCFKNVLNYCIKNKCKLIHISSTSVYGKQTNIVDEDCEKKFLKPQSPYADIKLIEENILSKNKNFS